MKEIFICNWGEANFSDSAHFNNFIKYLFSKSKSHKLNQNTKYNFYKRKVENKFKVGLLDDNEATYKKFLADLNFDLYQQFNNDLFYFYFMIQIDNYFITNLFSIEEQNVNLNIPEDLLSMIIDNYFNSVEEDLFDNIRETIKYINDKKLDIISYNELFNHEDNTYLIKQIEQFIHNSLKEKYPNENVVFQISHNDQSDKPYHIHRLIDNTY